MDQPFRIEPEDEPMQSLGYVVMGLGTDRQHPEPTDMVLTGFCTIGGARRRLGDFQKGVGNSMNYWDRSLGEYGGWRQYPDRNLRIVQVFAGPAIVWTPKPPAPPKAI